MKFRRLVIRVLLGSDRQRTARRDYGRGSALLRDDRVDHKYFTAPAFCDRLTKPMSSPRKRGSSRGDTTKRRRRLASHPASRPITPAPHLTSPRERGGER